jgi:hypothetical protein
MEKKKEWREFGELKGGDERRKETGRAHSFPDGS